MKYCILIYDKYNSITNYMLSDLKKAENVYFQYVISARCESSIKLLYYIKRLYSKTAWKIKKSRWISSIRTSADSVIITNEAMLGLTRQDVERLKSYGVKAYALLIDPVKAEYLSIAHARKLLDLFDRVYTFDPKDAEQFGYIYTNQLYSIPETENCSLQSESDLYYVGHLKGQEELIRGIIREGQLHSVRLHISLLVADKSLAHLTGAEILTKRLPYEKIIENVKKAKCILDITQKKQSGITLRYYEAVVYNKKLLTNNENIKKLPFYNDKYMKIYQTPENIDWEWVKNGEPPEYHYTNEFSPLRLMDTIE